MTITPARLPAAAAAVLALIVAAATALVVLGPGTGPDAGAAPPRARAATRPGPVAPAFAADELTDPRATPAAGTNRHGLPHLAAEQVLIPRQHVAAPVGVCAIVDDALEPPADVHRTCRWAGGADLGAGAGTTVITGHVNWVGQGTGALGNIARLRPGDAVLTTGRRGAVTRWRVVRVEFRSKTLGIEPRAFVGTAGPRALYLISCGGPFDPAEASYLDNIYVRAIPAVIGANRA